MTASHLIHFLGEGLNRLSKMQIKSDWPLYPARKVKSSSGEEAGEKYNFKTLLMVN